MTAFDEQILKAQGRPFQANGIDVLQVNVGYRCNQRCRHCHIAAHPDRQETMDRNTMDIVLAVLEKHHIGTLDITGGAPEMNPHFRYMVRAARDIAGTHVIVRTNLTIFSEPGMADIPEFFCDNAVEVIASLPHYTIPGVDAVRGDHTFEKSIAGIRRLNSLGYGDSEGLSLSLVYNPPQAALPDSQAELEAAYRKELSIRFGIIFNRLLVFSNMPIGRFRELLVMKNELGGYMGTARQAFNPATIEGLMCRHLISVGWDGTLFDCDFNQALGIPVKREYARHINNFDPDSLGSRLIATGEHCFVCAAGQGSS